MQQHTCAPRAEHSSHLAIRDDVLSGVIVRRKPQHRTFQCDPRLSAASMLRVTSTTPLSVT